MKNTKKVISLVLALTLAFSSVSAFAATGDMFGISSKSKEYTGIQVQTSTLLQNKMSTQYMNYAYEIDGKAYALKDLFDAFAANNKDLAATLEYVKANKTALFNVDTPIEGELKVEDVSAINTKKLEVTFSEEVVKTGQAENAANYVITKKDDASTVVVTTATLSVDEKVVTLNLATALDGDYIVTVNPIQSKADTTKTTPVFTQEISLKDTIKPALVSITYPVAGEAVLQMSEELDTLPGTVTISRVDGTAIGSETVTLDPNDASKIIVKPIVANKEYKVTLLGVKDKAGNIINPNPTQVTVKSALVDEVKPEVVSVEPKGLDKVIVTFSEEIDEATIALSLDGTPDAGISAVKNAKNPLVVEITLGGATTAGVHSVELSLFEDLATPANVGTTVTKNLQFAAAAAKLAKTTVATDNSKVTLTFDMNVTKTLTDVVLTRVDSDMVTTTVTVDNLDITAAGSDKDFVLAPTVANSLQLGFEPGKYTGELTVADVTPLGATDKIAISFEVKEAVDSEKATPTLGAIDNENLVVTFDKDMGPSALDVANYKVEGKNVFKEAIFDGNAKTVKLTFNPETILLDGDYEFTIDSAVKTKAGVAIKAFAEVATFEENVAPTVVKAVFTAPNTVTITFSEAVSSAADYAIVKVGGAEVSATVGALSSATGTITLDSAITDLTKTITLEFDEDIDVTDAKGNVLVPEASYTVAK